MALAHNHSIADLSTLPDCFHSAPRRPCSSPRLSPGSCVRKTRTVPTWCEHPAVKEHAQAFIRRLTI